MHSFRKALIVTISFVLILTAVICVIIYPALSVNSAYNDSVIRKELSGKTDYLFLGASQCQNGVMPTIINKELGCSSYNLSGPQMSMKGRYTLLKKEAERNNIKTVAIDISYDALNNTISDLKATGETQIVYKLDTFGEKAEYLLDTVSFLNGDYESMLSLMCRNGLSEWKVKLTGGSRVDKTQLGFLGNAGSSDMSITEDCAKELYKSIEKDMSFAKENIYWLKKTAELCREKQIELIIMVLPIPESEIWMSKNFGEFDSDLKKLCSEIGCKMYNFNFDKNRNKYLNDKTSFSNDTHLSSDGAEDFSYEYCDAMKKINNKEALDSIFYENCEEFIENSIYNK